MEKPTTKEKIIVDLDGNMKEATDAFFEDWLLFFFPNLHPLVDLSVAPIALQQEFQNIIAFASGKKKVVDKLYQITMKPVVKTVGRGKKRLKSPSKRLFCCIPKRKHRQSQLLRAACSCTPPLRLLSITED